VRPKTGSRSGYTYDLPWVAWPVKSKESVGMSDNFQHIDVDSDEFIDAPKALRDHVKKLQQINTRLTETNTDLSGRLTATALTDVLSEFKNPERVKRDLLSDKIDPLDSEAVKQWLGNNGGDYARGATGSTQSTDPSLAEDAAASQRMNSTDLTSPAGMSKFEAAQAEITDDMNGDQVKAVYRKHGV